MQLLEISGMFGTIQISNKEYDFLQAEQGLKDNNIALEEWKIKASSEKETVALKFENELEELSNSKSKATDNLERIKKLISREISKKENEQEAEIKRLASLNNENISKIKTTISGNKADSEKRLEEIKTLQNEELSNKGADTKRLA